MEKIIATDNNLKTIMSISESYNGRNSNLSKSLTDRFFHGDWHRRIRSWTNSSLILSCDTELVDISLYQALHNSLRAHLLL